MIETGIMTSPETAKQDFRATQEMWDKQNLKSPRFQKVMQSFSGMECTPEEANKIGVEFCERFAPGHQAVVVTHTDAEGGNVHNHITICSTNLETGKELNTSWSAYRVRDLSDSLCKEHGLSTIERTKSRCDERYTHAEKGLIERGKESWKDTLRENVQEAFKNSSDIDSFKEELKKAGIAVSERNRTYPDGKKELDFTYTDQDGHKCRAKNLGDDYTRRDICQSFDKQIEMQRDLNVTDKSNIQAEKGADRGLDATDKSNIKTDFGQEIHRIQEQRFNKISGRVDEISMNQYKQAFTATLGAVRDGLSVASAELERALPRDAGKLTSAAIDTIKNALDPSNLNPLNAVKNSINNSMDTICKLAEAGERNAQAFLKMGKIEELGLPKDWLYMDESTKGEALLRRSIRDDYGDEGKSLMSGYKNKVPQPKEHEHEPLVLTL